MLDIYRPNTSPKVIQVDVDGMTYERSLDVAGVELASLISKYRKVYHKRFDRPLKALVVQHTRMRLKQGRTKVRVANELGLSISTISSWMA